MVCSRARRRLAGRTEEELYRRLGLGLPPPELREDQGEIDAARSGKLPNLVTVEDIRGDLHVHTTATDGRASLREMAHAAQAKGYRYIAITDHSRRIAMAHGLDPKRLARQIDEIDQLNDELSEITVLKSIEVDILEDGSLDLPDQTLRRLDLVVGAIHSHLDFPQRKQTERLLRAMDNRYLNILAHPTGRLINQRPASAVDIERVMRGAVARRCYLELNAQPDRLDLTDAHCRLAKQVGLKVAISTDAHATVELDLMRFGVDQARRGWLQPEDVLNTRPLERAAGHAETAAIGAHNVQAQDQTGGGQWQTQIVRIGEPNDIQAQIAQLREQVDALMKENEPQAAGGATCTESTIAAPSAQRGSARKDSHPVFVSNLSSRC